MGQKKAFTVKRLNFGSWSVTLWISGNLFYQVQDVLDGPPPPPSPTFTNYTTMATCPTKGKRSMLFSVKFGIQRIQFSNRILSNLEKLSTLRNWQSNRICISFVSTSCAKTGFIRSVWFTTLFRLLTFEHRNLHLTSPTPKYLHSLSFRKEAPFCKHFPLVLLI